MAARERAVGRPSQPFAARRDMSVDIERPYWEERVAQGDNRLRSKCGVALINAHLHDHLQTSRNP